MSADSPDFMLSASLAAHDNEVRALAALGDMVFTGAQDRMLFAWTRVDGVWVQTGASPVHEHWITAALAFAPGVHPLLPQGGVATGSMDKRIRVFDTQCTCVQTLSGHSGGVISLALTPNHRLLSGSWDGTAREWDLNSGTELTVMPGHENGVAVHALADGTIVTGSTGMQQGDGITGYQIRMWRDGEMQRQIRDHEAAIRAFAVSATGFASAGNDGSVRLRGPDGATVQTLQSPATHEGRPPFLLSLVALPTGELASGGDDCTVRVWRDGECAQEIAVPNTVWSLACTDRGDLVAGCGDRMAYLFTRDAARAASDSDREALEKALSANGASEVDVAALPKWEDRANHRAKQGGIQVFNKAGKAWAARWDEADQTWMEIGEVTGTQGGSVSDLSGGGGGGGLQLSQGKQELDGEFYDRVVPVEAETPDGMRTLKLGFNFTDDQYAVAQVFAAKHGLPDMYVEQIVDYMRQQTPSHLTAAQVGMTPGAGGAAGTSGSGSASGQPALQTLPPRAYLRFEGGNFAGLRKKVVEFNDALAAEGAPTAMNAAASSRFEEVVNVLEDTSRYHASTLPTATPVVLRQLLCWPTERAFPAADLLRALLLHPGVGTAVGPADMQGLLASAFRAASVTAAERPLVMLALRAAANAFVHDGPREAVLTLRHEVLDLVKGGLRIAHKTVVHAAGVVLQNLALAVHRKCGSASAEPWVAETMQPLVAQAVRILQSPVEGAGAGRDAARKALGTALLCAPALVGEVQRAGVEDALGDDETGREVAGLLAK